MFIPTDEAARSSRATWSFWSLPQVTCRSVAAMLWSRLRSMDDGDRAPRVREEVCACCAPASRHRAACAHAKVPDATARRGSVIAARRRTRGASNSCGPRAYRGDQRHGDILDAPCRSRSLFVERILELSVGGGRNALQLRVVPLPLFGVRKYCVRLVNHADHLLVGMTIQTLFDRLIGSLDSRRGCAGRQVQEIVVGIVVHDTILGCVGMWGTRL